MTELVWIIAIAGAVFFGIVEGIALGMSSIKITVIARMGNDYPDDPEREDIRKRKADVVELFPRRTA